MLRLVVDVDGTVHTEVALTAAEKGRQAMADWDGPKMLTHRDSCLRTAREGEALYRTRYERAMRAVEALEHALETHTPAAKARARALAVKARE